VAQRVLFVVSFKHAMERTIGYSCWMAEMTSGTESFEKPIPARSPPHPLVILVTIADKDELEHGSSAQAPCSQLVKG